MNPNNPFSKSPWGLIFILFGAGILSAFQVGKVPPVLSDMRADLGISLFDAGWLLSVFTFTGLLMGTFTGAIADALGHRRLMLAGLVLQAAGSLSGSFALSYPGLLATRILEGTGFLAVIISTPTLIFQVVKPRDLKLALSIWTCYVPLGVSLMMVLLPVILMGTDWRGVWQINAAGRLLEMGLARFKLIALAGVVMGISAMVIYLDTPHFIINYSGCLIFSIFGGLIPACVLGAVPAYAPSKNRVATTNVLVVQFGQFGQVIGPPVLAFLVSQTGSWTAGSWFLGCVAGLGVVLSFFLSRIHPRQRGGDKIRN